MTSNGIQFSVNYSPLLAELVQSGQVRLDRFKCPAWPDLCAAAQATLPVYIHFPLDIGWGRGSSYDSERKAPADLEYFADLLAMTGTPYINTHLFPFQGDYPDIPRTSLAPQHARRIMDAALRDLEPLIHRFGAERILVENAIAEGDRMVLGVLPEVFHPLLEETGCGFLFDLSHARLAAEGLGLEPYAYFEALPVARIREVHLTGLQVIEGRWLDLLAEVNDPNWSAERLDGMKLDHFPMIDDDWPVTGWVMDRIHSGLWSQPWVVAFEYGGVGGFWTRLSDRSVYLEQLPRLEKLVKKTREPQRHKETKEAKT